MSMSEKSIKRVHLIYGIVLSVLLVTVAVLFAVMCVDIYREGPNPFTRESIKEHFASISAVVYITLAVIIIGGIFNTACPLEKSKLKGASNDGIALRRLLNKLKSLSPEGGDAIERQRIIRFAMIIVSLVFILFASIGSFVYICTNFDASGTNINASVASGWLSILWFFVGPFIYLIVTAYVCKRSIKKELEIVKGEFKKSQASEADTCDIQKNQGTFTKLTSEMKETVERAKAPKKWHRYFSLGFKIAVAVVIVVFIIVGVENGGMEDVVSKANKICAECIGLG